jgi:hypothetical protein
MAQNSHKTMASSAACSHAHLADRQQYAAQLTGPTRLAAMQQTATPKMNACQTDFARTAKQRMAWNPQSTLHGYPEHCRPYTYLRHHIAILQTSVPTAIGPAAIV